MQVHQPWHSGMLIWTWRDAPGWKEINKCRSISHGIWECSLGHGWMYLAGKKEINAGPSAMAFGNAHLDTEECTCLERNKKMPVHQPWHLGMLAIHHTYVTHISHIHHAYIMHTSRIHHAY